MVPGDYNILDDDTAADVHFEYIERFNREMPHDQIVEELCREFAEYLADAHAPLVWLAIAKAQWSCAALAPRVLERVREIVEKGEGLGLWAETGECELARRRKALSEFLAKLQTTNPRPRKPHAVWDLREDVIILQHRWNRDKR